MRQYLQSGQRRIYLWGYLLVVLIAALPLFAHLDELPLVLYDEQRLATNALEMRESGNWLLTTYEGQPDYLNTKPPLMIWLQVISMSLFGYNELAVRLPSAMAALATCLLLYAFSVRRFRSPLLGILAVFVLCTAKGYTEIHGTRTGDYDALLTLFTTTYCLAWFSFLEDGKTLQLYLFFTTLMLAVLTKCTAACLMLPALLLYTLLRGKIRAVLSNPHFYLGVLLLVVPVAAWYILRQQVDPGYLSSVWHMDIGGRYKEVMSFVFGPWYYLSLLANESFVPWLPLAIAGILTAHYSKDSQLRRLSLFLLIILLVFIGVLSFSATKFYWYLLPSYPLLALLAAIAIRFLLQAVTERIAFRHTKQKALFYATALLLLFVWPYTQALDRSINVKLHESTMENMVMGFYMKDALHGRRELDGLSLGMEGGEGNIRWYIKALAIKGVPLQVIEDRKFAAGQKIIAFQQNLKEHIESHFETRLLEDFRGVHVYEIVQPKSI
jgi:4-amino-4-deoxy-L-arabinose transferase-like glycosyltransferase